MNSSVRIALAVALLVFAILVHAADIHSASTDNLKEFVHAQFGEHFTPTPMPGSATVLVTGDLDGDGQEDAVIVTKSKEPLADQLKFGYKVVDPLDSYYGWGNPQDTVQFASADPDRSRVLLIVHSWRTSAPKAKFAVINIPFTELSIEDVTLKKKLRTVISATDQDTMRSYLFWDGKKWKYEPGPME